MGKKLEKIAQKESSGIINTQSYIFKQGFIIGYEKCVNQIIKHIKINQKSEDIEVLNYIKELLK